MKACGGLWCARYHCPQAGEERCEASCRQTRRSPVHRRTSVGLSAALALAHRFFSTGCCTQQLRILRLLKRLSSQLPSEDERRAMEAEL